MRFMMLYKPGKESTIPPTPEHMAEMGRYIEKLSKTGVLLATDGLLKYTSPDRIMEVCRRNSADEAARQLIELVRYASGALPDDVTVIVCPIGI